MRNINDFTRGLDNVVAATQKTLDDLGIKGAKALTSGTINFGGAQISIVAQSKYLSTTFSLGEIEDSNGGVAPQVRAKIRGFVSRFAALGNSEPSEPQGMPEERPTR